MEDGCLMTTSVKWFAALCGLLLAGVMLSRAPGQAPGKPGIDYASPTLGTLTAGGGTPSSDPDSWPQFRGPNRDNISPAAKNLYRTWPAGGPKVLWTITGLGPGFSSAAIHAGKVYFHDYDEPAKRWMARCVSLADGKEIWRWSYERAIEDNHKITRSVPAVDDQFVISLDPMCVLHCFEAATGKRLWAKDLVAEFGTRIPQWYNGQCPLNEPDRVVIGIGGKDVLLAAVEKATGKLLWQTPNAARIDMAHSSLMPMTLAGRRQYVWSTMKGALGVDAADGRLLWRGPVTPENRLAWKPNIAAAPSAVAFGPDRVLLTSSYKAGSVLFTVQPAGAGLLPRAEQVMTADQFASDCQTPIVWWDRLFAISGDRFTCLGLDGKVAWASPDGLRFGLGSFLLADGLFFILEGGSDKPPSEGGKLHLVEASTDGWKELASAQVLGGYDVWAPMAIANGKLVLRDLAKMVCLEVGPGK